MRRTCFASWTGRTAKGWLQSGAQWLAALVLAICQPATAAPAAPLQKLVVLDFEQVGDLGDEAMVAARALRMERTAAELKRKLADAGLFDVLDDAPARPMIERLRSSQYLHECNGCELDIARALGADVVLVSWIYRMSQLVITMHFEMKEAATGRLVMKRTLNFRNDVDGSWSREVDYLVRDLKEGKRWNGEGPG